MAKTYVVTKEFEGLTACKEKMTLHVGEEYPVVGLFIATNGTPAKGIFKIDSQNAFEYMGDNFDGNGMRRGQLTWAIAFSPREQLSKDGHFQRFSEAEIRTLEKKWKKFLVEGTEAILFNRDFYHASIEELEKLARDIHIKVK